MTDTRNEIDTTVAETIQAQIGHQAFVMLGAYQLVALADGLKFRIRGSRLGNLIIVQYNAGRDVYDLSLWDVRGVNTKLRNRYHDHQAGELLTAIEGMTGLATSLGTMKGGR